MDATPGQSGKESAKAKEIEQFAYFMIRVRRTSKSSKGDSLSGMIEELATGEKESFASGAELIRILCRSPGPPPAAGGESEPTLSPHNGR
jgi:hypothetical protein